MHEGLLLKRKMTSIFVDSKHTMQSNICPASRPRWIISRFLVLLAVFGTAATTPCQVWEKLVAPGLTYRSEVDSTVPRMIHALRWSPKSKVVQAVPELGGGTVYEDNASKGRETISAMLQRTGALAAINADFFPFTGDPLGLMVRNKELLSLPFPGRSVIGWGPGGTTIGRPVPRLAFSVEGAPGIAVPQFNEDCKSNSITLNSERAGIARSSTQSCVHAVVKVTSGSWNVNGKVEGEVQFLMSDAIAIPIAPGNCFITATGTMMPFVAGLRPGNQVVFDLTVDGFDWAKIDHAIGGGPNLVSSGAVSVDAEAQGFDPPFLKRHPRSAVGRTKEGDIWWVTIDGRQKLSDGATLEELARVMQRLGCQDAINLDGGGSTTLNILGVGVNRPSEGREREVANGVVFLGAAPPKENTAYGLSTPPQMISGTTSYLRVLDSGQNPIPNAEVIWSASGSGWIDQGGFLRATAEGTVFITAWVRGQTLSAGIAVQPAPPKPPPLTR